MKKAVLISIHPEWCEKIASGQKTIEVRKTRPKIDTPFKCYIYETKSINHNSILVDLDGNQRTVYAKGCGKIIGVFVCDKIHDCDADSAGLFDKVTRKHLPECCLDWKQIFSYAKGVLPLYGWHISDLVIYDKPRELSSFIKPGAMTQEELDDDLCIYCDLGDKRHDYSCEKASCSEAYIDYLSHEKYIIDRPPQSWCYVEKIQ